MHCRRVALVVRPRERGSRRDQRVEVRRLNLLVSEGRDRVVGLIVDEQEVDRLFDLSLFPIPEVKPVTVLARLHILQMETFLHRIGSGPLTADHRVFGTQDHHIGPWRHAC